MPDYIQAKGEVNKVVVEAFRNRNIVIPLPQQEVRLLENADAPMQARAAQP